MRVDLITIFPAYFSPLELSLLGKARAAGLLDVRVHDLRSWTDDPHHAVDDAPYGGGPGMVMRPEVWGRALDDVVPADALPPLLVVPTPAGRLFDQAIAQDYAAEPWLVFACGRYEGIDGRVAADAGRRMRVDEVSIGDVVVAGGEVAALVVVEAAARLLPGVVGNPDSIGSDSHQEGLLEGPVYTRPARWRDLEVPEVLLSGDHQAIARWQRDEALRRTATRRPDLLARLDRATLDERDRAVLLEAAQSDVAQ
ncbi:MAG: tRNA (guanosine(37)-N1)-methyltransferase TrmD [Actinomycetes bacterium]